MMRLRVPATSANLGPGFDSLGLAVTLYNHFEYRESDRILVEGCAPGHSGADNLFVASFRRGYEELGRPFRGLHVVFEAAIPVARGLGSSAACIVGGLLAASLAASQGEGEGRGEGGRFGALGEEGILRLAAGIEGHPDNVAPALLGGFCASVMDGKGVVAVRKVLSPGLRFAALVPPFPLETQVARAALPKTLPFADAVYNVTRASVVSAAFASGDLRAVSRLLGSHEGADRLHEPWRAPLIPGFPELRSAALDAGASAVWLSGAGPTIMSMLDGKAVRAGEFARGMEEVLHRPEGAWRLIGLEADGEGAMAVSGRRDA